MKCRNSSDAHDTAQANADRDGREWVYFCDTSGNWRAEPRHGRAVGPANRTWTGVEFCLVAPRASADSRQRR